MSRIRGRQELLGGRLLKALKGASPEESRLRVRLLGAQSRQSFLSGKDYGCNFVLVLGVLCGEQIHHMRDLVLVSSRVDREGLSIART
jgi:hypothetical protein